MSAVASLSSDQIRVEPGGEATLTMTVRNTGSVVDEYALAVVGEAKEWAVVEPASVSLLPEQSETVTVRFTPPRSPKVIAGAVPFAVKVMPYEQPHQATAEEGVVEVEPFAELAAELVPRTSRGRRQGRHQLAIDNRGNTALDLRLSAADADRLLLFKLDPADATVGAGRATFTNLTVVPRKRFWRGQPKTLPFQVLIEPVGDGVPLAVDATFVQEPRLPKWLPKALLGLLALAAALVALWFLLLRPVIESTAREAAEEEVAEQMSEVAAAQSEVAAQAEEAQETAAAAEEAAASAEEAAGVASEQALVLSAQADQAQQLFAGQDLGDPIDFRLGGQTIAPGAEGEDIFTVPDDGTLALTDIVLQNPQGDEGLLQIRREDAEGETSVLLETRLENFRDLDYHFVSPVWFGPEESVSVFVECENTNGEDCRGSAYLTGYAGEIPEEDSTETGSPSGG